MAVFIRIGVVALAIKLGNSQEVNATAQAFVIPSGCQTKCGIEKYTAALQEHTGKMFEEYGKLIQKIGTSEFASSVGDIVEQLWTGNFDVTCEFKDILTCVSENRDLCTPTSSLFDGLWDSTSFFDTMFKTIDVVAASDEAECLCSACPAVKPALAKYHAGVAEAVASAVLSPAPIDGMPEQLKTAMLEGMCPMFGAFSCFETQPKCAKLDSAIKEGQKLFNTWGPHFLVEEAEKTKASCTAAGVSMELQSVSDGKSSGGFLSGSTAASGVFAFGLLLVVFLVR